MLMALKLRLAIGVVGGKVKLKIGGWFVTTYPLCYDDDNITLSLGVVYAKNFLFRGSDRNLSI